MQMDCDLYAGSVVVSAIIADCLWNAQTRTALKVNQDSRNEYTLAVLGVSTNIREPAYGIHPQKLLGKLTRVQEMSRG
jgi:hypothetical protein